MFAVMITSHELHRNLFSILTKQKKYIWHATEDGTEVATDKPKIILPVQHKNYQS